MFVLYQSNERRVVSRAQRIQGRIFKATVSWKYRLAEMGEG